MSATAFAAPSGVEIPRDQWGRPMIKLPGGGIKAYTRASTVGKAIEDTYHLSLWQQRQVLRGAVKHPELLVLVDELGDEPARDGEEYKLWKGRLDEIVQQAHEAAGSHDRAGLGTYLHSVFEAIDTGEQVPPIPSQYAHRYTVAERDRDAAARAKATEGWRWLVREQFVVNDEWRVAGTLDGLVLVPDPNLPGRWLIRTADDKTGASMDFAGLGYCAQVAVYTDSLIYDPETGERTTFHALLPEDIDPGTVRLDTETAVIVHTPLGEGRCDIYRVPLAEGRAAVAMATDVRSMRTASKRWLAKLSSHEEPRLVADVEPARASDPVDLISDLIAGATTVAELVAIREEYTKPVDYGNGRVTVPWTDAHDDLAGARAALVGSKPVDPVLAEIEAAADMAALGAVWERHQGTWTGEHDAAAAAKAAELSKPPY